jgi:hypothetical protein
MLHPQWAQSVAQTTFSFVSFIFMISCMYSMEFCSICDETKKPPNMKAENLQRRDIHDFSEGLKSGFLLNFKYWEIDGLAPFSKIENHPKNSVRSTMTMDHSSMKNLAAAVKKRRFIQFFFFKAKGTPTLHTYIQPIAATR